MTRAQVAELLALAAAVYPAVQVTDAMVAAWALVIEDLDARAAQQALVAHMATSRFFPAPAEIRRLVAEAVAELPPVDEAWAEVCEAIHRHGRYSRPRLSPAVAQAVEVLGWSELCSSTLPAADRAHFREVYAAIRGRRIRELQLPSAARAFATRPRRHALIRRLQCGVAEQHSEAMRTDNGADIGIEA